MASIRRRVSSSQILPLGDPSTLTKAGPNVPHAVEWPSSAPAASPIASLLAWLAGGVPAECRDGRSFRTFAGHSPNLVHGVNFMMKT